MVKGPLKIKFKLCSILYNIALTGLFELYTSGGHLNHEAKPSGLNARLECTIQYKWLILCALTPCALPW